MLYYHGTVRDYLPSIMSEGLKPSPENMWKVTSFGKEIESTEESQCCVYLTASKQIAEGFARGKTQYLRTKPGNYFTFFFIKPNGEIATKFMRKKLNTPVLTTSPVVLKIDMDYPTETDPHTTYGSIYRGIIPPQQIGEL
jgi:hypothetical protein